MVIFNSYVKLPQGNYHSIHVAFWKSYMAASNSPYFPIEAEGFPSQLKDSQPGVNNSQLTYHHVQWLSNVMNMFNFRVNYKQVSSPLFYYIYMSHQTPIHNYPITYTEHEYGLHMQAYIMCIYIYIYIIYTH